MLDIKFIRDHEDEVRRALERRGKAVSLDELCALDRERRKLVTEVDALKQQRNADSEEIGRLKKAGQDTADRQAAVKDLGNKIAALDQRLRLLEPELTKLLLNIPNTPHVSVP